MISIDGSAFQTPFRPEYPVSQKKKSFFFLLPSHFFYCATLFSFTILVNIIVLDDYKAFCKHVLDGTSVIKSTATAVVMQLQPFDT